MCIRDRLNPEREREQKFLKRYVEYCRATCSPRLVPKSAKLLEDQYVRYRQEMRERAKRGGGAPAVPITVRQLEAITRVSESLAKMCLQDKVSEEHVQESLRLFEVSTVDAARSGAAEMAVLTPEQREELTLVETQIKQKLAIGATASSPSLSDPGSILVTYSEMSLSLDKSGIFLTSTTRLTGFETFAAEACTA